MNRVWQQLDVRRTDVEAHPFFAWLASEAVPLEQRFAFSPVMIDFIMGFADMNKWFLRYEDPQNELERAINDHTDEDATHSRLFYDNWYSLELAGVETWPPGKMLWWMFHSQQAAAVRRFGMEILDLTVNYPDPLVRFPMMEAIEICGDVFFGHTAPIATTATRKYGIRHDYFGQYHRARETGHLQSDEAMFKSAVLSPAQLRHASYVANVVFDSFLRVLDELLDYSRRVTSAPPALMEELRRDYDMALKKPLRASEAADSEAPGGVLFGAHQGFASLIEQRVQRLRRHPLLHWLREENGMPPREKLQRFVALWGIDIAGYKDFNELVLRYPQPSTADEHRINRWTGDLASHGVLYLQDWQALGLDAALAWDPGETIAFYFLSSQTETHRRHMADIKKYAFRYKQPVVRYWLMRALEAAGGPLFAGTRPLAEAAEHSDDLVLDYWADRHTLTHPERNDNGDPGPMQCLATAPSSEEAEVITTLIALVFDNMAGLYALSLKEALNGTFVRAPASLPPPRVSDIVLRARAADEEGNPATTGAAVIAMKEPRYRATL
jgi:hypothetical protein